MAGFVKSIYPQWAKRRKRSNGSTLAGFCPQRAALAGARAGAEISGLIPNCEPLLAQLSASLLPHAERSACCLVQRVPLILSAGGATPPEQGFDMRSQLQAKRTAKERRWPEDN
jgi:hypothetical protein